MPELRVTSAYRPTGDQPQAIARARRSRSSAGDRFQTLLGATGTGKTATMAWIDRAGPAPGARDRAQQDARRAALQRVPRVLPGRTPSSTSSPTTTTTSPRRTSRRPTSTSRRTRRRTTTSTGCGTRRRRRCFTRRDVVVVASVSCIYGLGSPEEWRERVADPRRSARSTTATLVLRKLIDIQYVRNDTVLGRGRFRVQGRRGRGAAGERGDRVPRSRSSATRSSRSRTSTRSPARSTRSSTTSRSGRRREYVTSKPTIERAVDEIRHELEEQVARFEARGQACSRRTGSASAPSTTWR